MDIPLLHDFSSVFFYFCFGTLLLHDYLINTCNKIHSIFVSCMALNSAQSHFILYILEWYFTVLCFLSYRIMHEQLISGNHIQLYVDTDAKAHWQQHQGYKCTRSFNFTLSCKHLNNKHNMHLRVHLLYSSIKLWGIINLSLIFIKPNV